MIKILIFSSLIFMVSCFVNENKVRFVATKYNEDVKKYTLEQFFHSPRNSNNHFIGIFYDESKSLSGRKLLKLYSQDSISLDQRYYAAHPLKILTWSETSIIINASVISTHGDSIQRKLYLDASVDKNNSIGRYKIKYNKDFNFPIK